MTTQKTAVKHFRFSLMQRCSSFDIIFKASVDEYLRLFLVVLSRTACLPCTNSIACTLFLSLLSCLLLFFFGCRRFIWNFFRLENEHLNNCGQFRAVRDISVVPIDTGDQALLEQLMDDIDGQVFSTKKSRRKSSIIMKSLRKFSSRPEGNRVDDIIVIDIDRETQV